MPDKTIDLVGLAIADMRIAGAILRRPRGDVRWLDIRGLQGAQTAAASTDPRAIDTYFGAVDAVLARTPRLRNRGYRIERAD